LNRSVKIFSSPSELAGKLAEELVRIIADSAERKKPLTIALSGGNTPALLFEILSNRFSGSTQWDYVHFFWGDERCVPPDDEESNFGMTNRTLFSKIDIPSDNIHRIKGEMDPEEEAFRYSEEIAGFLGKRDGLPLFDVMLLGLGEDGHTASIFQSNMELLYSDKVCEVASHPVTLQKRITITGRVINNSDLLVFLVAGKKKAEIVNKILINREKALNFPASHIVPVYGVLSWYLDKEAGVLL
jgi:6-phosphogluconolactonase